MGAGMRAAEYSQVRRPGGDPLLLGDPLLPLRGVGRRRVQVEVVQRGLGIGRVEVRGLVEGELDLRRPSGGRERWRPVGEVQVEEGAVDHWRIADEGEDPHLAA